MPNPLVIDISHHQPEPIDWSQVRAGGTVGVIHKATEGDGYVDDMLFKRARAAMDAGLSWSTYHFLRPGDMAGQMQHYLTTIDPRPGERMCLDHEDAGVSLSELRQCVQILIAHPNNLQVTIYSGHLIEEQLAGKRDDYLAENTSLWTAEYADRPSEVEWNSATWPVPSLWQYTDSASVSGIDGPVDGNKWNGSKEALVKWFGPAEVAPPAPTPEPEPVEVPEIVADVSVKGEVRFALVVNGIMVWSTEDDVA
jgi:lysozyme